MFLVLIGLITISPKYVGNQYEDSPQGIRLHRFYATMEREGLATLRQ